AHPTSHSHCPFYPQGSDHHRHPQSFLHDALPILEANRETSIHKYTWRKIDTGIRLTNWLKGYRCICRSNNWTHEDDMFFREQIRSEEHTSELQSRFDLVCRLLVETKHQET